MGQPEEGDALRRAKFEEHGDGIDSTRPGHSIARLVLRVVESNETTSRSIDRLIASLEQAGERSDKLAKALVRATLALVAATAVLAVMELLSFLCAP